MRFSTSRTSAALAQEQVLSLFRIVVGLLFACHGAASLFGVLGGAFGGGTVAAGTWPGWYAAVIQFVGGGLVMLGLGTRYAALICSGSMAYAYFTEHQQHALWPIQNGGEPAALYAWTFLLIVVAGPGRWSLDALFGRIAANNTVTAVAPAAAVLASGSHDGNDTGSVTPARSEVPASSSV
ncbi:DoxX family protein [Streptomyces sp. SID13666]|uniref:DoxX family protein n=1 Tax=unclassified Streptomyces TaxID=2593676 RepID=UPI0013C2561A|nr:MULTISPECIES: DoxX family protein [unclassified Streptomyces]NEA53760.1 DoxX family protein [Streptomyces sp. SID13666]NEA71538.1 DoxX family protein [Streptomyces sp. SID13588]